MIHMANENEWKTCMYGLGKIGQNYGYEFLYYYGIEPYLFGDRDEQVLNKFDCSLDKKIAFEELIKTEDHILVFVTVGFAYEKEIIEQLSINPKIHIITWTQICNDSLALKRFLQIENFPNKKNNKKQLYEYTMGAGNKHNEKIAVYTCITGNYDYPLEILNKEDRCDYFLISDLKEGTNMVNEQYYRRINTSKVVPKEYITAKDKNRYCKMHGYKIFSDYDYSIYIDGNLQIIGKIS